MLQQKMYDNFFLSIDANDNGDIRVQPTLNINHSLWDRIARLNALWY